MVLFESSTFVVKNFVADTLSCSMWNLELKKPDSTAKYGMVVAKRLNLISIIERICEILLQVSHWSSTGHFKLN